MEAIVLARKNFREFDQIISLYTKEKGKLELLARGVKKSVSKNSAHLEPFSYNFIEYAAGKEIDHLTRAVSINYFAKIRQNLTKNIISGFVCSLLEKILDTKEPDQRIFDSLLSWLKFVDKNEKVDFLLIDSLVIIIFSFLGFYPIIDKCVVCDKSLKEMVKNNLLSGGREKIGFHFSGGGVVCSDCREIKKETGEKILDCNLPEISGLQVLLQGDWRTVLDFVENEKEKKALHRLVYEFVLFHSEREISDWMEFDKMVGKRTGA